MTTNAVETPQSGSHRCDLLCPVEHRMRKVPRFLDSECNMLTTAQTLACKGAGEAIVRGSTGPELYDLFPKGPAKVAARIAGIPNHRGPI